MTDDLPPFSWQHVSKLLRDQGVKGMTRSMLAQVLKCKYEDSRLTKVLAQLTEQKRIREIVGPGSIILVSVEGFENPVLDELEQVDSVKEKNPRGRA